MKKIVYISLEADIVHPGNLSIIKHASSLGEVIVGLMTDNAIAKHKRLPLLEFEQRKTSINERNQ